METFKYTVQIEIVADSGLQMGNRLCITTVGLLKMPTSQNAVHMDVRRSIDVRIMIPNGRPSPF